MEEALAATAAECDAEVADRSLLKDALFSTRYGLFMADLFACAETNS